MNQRSHCLDAVQIFVYVRPLLSKTMHVSAFYFMCVFLHQSSKHMSASYPFALIGKFSFTVHFAKKFPRSCIGLSKCFSGFTICTPKRYRCKRKTHLIMARNCSGCLKPYNFQLQTGNAQRHQNCKYFFTRQWPFGTWGPRHLQGEIQYRIIMIDRFYHGVIFTSKISDKPSCSNSTELLAWPKRPSALLTT